jgi:hypothetical protein
LHRAIKQAEHVLVFGELTIQKLGNYEKVSVAPVKYDMSIASKCRAFIYIHGLINFTGICLQIEEWGLCCVPVKLPHEWWCRESEV